MPSAIKSLKRSSLGQVLSSLLRRVSGALSSAEDSSGESWRRFVAARDLAATLGATETIHSMIYLVAPIERSGHNFVASLLEKHPSVAVPTGSRLPGEHHILQESSSLVQYARETVQRQSGWINGEVDVLDRHVALLLRSLGNGIIGHYRGFISPEQTLLLKAPTTENLEDFFALFPESKLVCLTRDGRDTVASYTKTWGDSHFDAAAQRWATRTDLLLDVLEAFPDRTHWIRYEHAYEDERQAVEPMLRLCNLDPSLYPFDEVDSIPIIGSSSHSVTADGSVDWSIKPSKSESPSFSPVGRWEKWPTSLRKRFADRAQKTLIRSEYVVDDQWVRSI